MRSIDANLLFYTFNADTPEHESALAFVESQASREDVILSGLGFSRVWNPLVPE